GSFSATLKTAGNQTLTATDTATSSITGTSGTIAVSPAAATHFGVSASPASITAGGAVTVAVTALADFNNTATGYTGTVHFTSTARPASPPAHTTLTHSAGTFSATFAKSGSQTLTATDTANGALTGTSSPIAVRGLIVTGFTPTPTGFSVTFSKAFVNS